MIRGLCALLRRGGERFSAIDGEQWASALAYSAFASLFPLILLFITVASFAIDPHRAGRAMIAFVEQYVPMSEQTRNVVFSVIAGMVEARGQAGATALVLLAWTASRCFSTLIGATNRAWGISVTDWWRLPAKSLALLALMAVAALLGLAASTLMRLAVRLLPGWANELESLLLPMAVEYLGLALFYRFAPRRSTRFSEVLPPALVAALLLRAAESVFVIYIQYFGAANAVYGVFGGIMALLFWIYLSGCIVIYGACLCAAFALPPQ